MLSKRKFIFILIFACIIIVWQLGEATTGPSAVIRQNKEQASRYLQDKYPGMEYKITDHSFLTERMNVAHVKVETKIDNQPLIFTVTVDADGDITDDYGERVISYNIKNQIVPLVNNLFSQTIVDVRTVKSGTEYFSYIDIRWEESLSKEAFLEQCLAIRDILINNTNDIDLITFTCDNTKGQYFELKLGKEQLEYSKEKIINEKLVKQL
ncbi:hypothetical protein [Thermotalea metallivorans]|uniref:Uncharacterized protein n=1 Tax=Thermotalea metallivorans TaxID=520762 RepID=A0A140LEG1_9FIRM|nr:hypothetical protein [Thermotalea metallivorans]KXG78936.1 hypothetical protein AN619_00960 [Thermotalea metallivorans]